MDRQYIQKLLGGYATGTLTPEEQQALFEAALTDQELFDALAREQSLRDLLRDPAARAHLLASIDEAPLPWYRRFWRPVAIVATAAAGLLAVGVYVAREKPKPAAPAPLMALMKEPPAPRVEVPLPPPPPAPAVRKPRVVVARKEFAPPAASPAAAAAPPENALKKSEAVEVTAAAGAVPMAAPPKDDLVVANATPGRLQSAFLDSGSKPIPLQNAQALFYAQPLQDVTVQAEQSAGMQQQQQKQAAPSQADNKNLARSLKTLAALGAVTRVAHLGVKWTILRKRDGDEFVEVAPDQLRAGDAVKLKLIPNDDGFLSVWEGGAALVSGTKVERLKEFETPVISSSQAGQRILTVLCTRTAAQPGIVRKAVEQQSATDSREHATYVLNVNDSLAAPVSVNIPLIFK